MELSFDPSLFELVILDSDRSLFGIVGPMSNDTETECRMVEFRHAGRRMSIDGPVNHSLSRARNLTDIAKRTGFAFADDIYRSADHNSKKSS